ncbi:response regulator [Alsobacter sp. SYSU BS001988]
MTGLWRLSVLVVDDFAPMLTIVMKLLAQLDIHDVDCSMSVMGALDSVARRDYDLLILDYFLGEETGDELVHRLKLTGQTIPAIIMTGEPEKAMQLTGRNGDWLRKPFTAEDLRERIVAALA